MKCPTTYAWENDLVQKFKSENNSASFKYQLTVLPDERSWVKKKGEGYIFKETRSNLQFFTGDADYY